MLRRSVFMVALGLLVLPGLILTGCSSLPVGGSPGNPGDGVSQGSIAGVVIDSENGQPVPGATVRLGSRVLALNAGAFEANSLPVGTMSLTIEASGYKPFQTSVEIKTGTPTYLTIDLEKHKAEEPPRYGTLSSVVVDQTSGLKLWSGTVAVNGAASRFSGGGFRLTGLQAGRHTITVSATFYQTFTGQVDITAGRETSVTIQMRPAFSWSDIDLLARLVQSEAGAEPYLGQVAVAATVLNRVLSPLFPNTIPGVVYHVWNGYYQYEPVLRGTINIPAGQRALDAAYDAIAGWDPSYGATGFFNPAKTNDQWVRSKPITTVIGNHVFFRQ
ncbi:MAG: carboxypeptidase regulatory-like domain-containing protein [Firmicutes bacterium]|nr:carboxypeptidase regulatory-like domain-containing protein [Bacillota bacterium]